MFRWPGHEGGEEEGVIGGGQCVGGSGIGGIGVKRDEEVSTTSLLRLCYTTRKNEVAYHSDSPFLDHDERYPWT